MPLVKYVFKAGVNKEGTNYSNENGWFDADKVRFRKGKPERIGGWTKNSLNTFIGTCRRIYPYRSIDGTNWVVLGTHQKLYIKQGENFNDITPIRATTTNGIVFSATSGSAVITATDDDHGAVVGDFVTISGAATLGGLITAAVLNQEYQIASVPTVDTYTFTTSSATDAKLQFRGHLSKQKCEAVKFEIYDADNTASTGDGFAIDHIALEVGIKKGTFRTTETNTIGAD